jgi:hypothetical protein
MAAVLDCHQQHDQPKDVLVATCPVLRQLGSDAAVLTQGIAASDLLHLASACTATITPSALEQVAAGPCFDILEELMDPNLAGDNSKASDGRDAVHARDLSARLRCAFELCYHATDQAAL